MELLRCPLLQVGGRTYRVYGGRSAGGQQRGQAGEEEDYGGGWRRGPAYDEEEDEAVDDGSITQEGAQFVYRLEVDAEVGGVGPLLSCGPWPAASQPGHQPASQGLLAASAAHRLCCRADVDPVSSLLLHPLLRRS